MKKILYILLIVPSLFFAVGAMHAVEEDPQGRCVCVDKQNPKITYKDEVMYKSQCDGFEAVNAGQNLGTGWRCEFNTAKSCCCQETSGSATCKTVYESRYGDAGCSAKKFSGSSPVDSVYITKPYPVTADPSQPEPVCADYAKQLYCCCRQVDDDGKKIPTQCKQTFYSTSCNAATFGKKDDFSGLVSDSYQNKVDAGYNNPVVMPAGGSCDTLEKPKSDVAKEATTALSATLAKYQSEAEKLNKVSYLNGVKGLIGRVISFFLFTIGSFSFVLYLYAGVLWMTAAGNSEQTQQAKNIFLWTSLGLVALFGSYVVISQVIQFVQTGGTI